MRQSYELTGLIGEGRAGRLYRALLHGEGGFRKEVALRLLGPEQASPAALEALREEARLVALVDHPGLVATEPPRRTRLGWVVEHDHVDGVSLDRAMAAGLPPAARVEVVAEVARILRALHQATDPQGQPLPLVHHDLRPRNILISRTGAVVLQGGGLARQAAPGRADPSTMGPAAWVAPERAAGHDLPSSDVYSLGRTLSALFDPSTWPQGGEGALPPESVLDLARSLSAYHPGERPSADQAETRARALGRQLPGPSLREWAAEAVPPLLLVQRDAPHVGRRLSLDPDAGGGPARWLAVLLAGLALIALAASWWLRPAAPVDAELERHPVVDLRRGRLPEGAPLVLPDMVVTALEDDGFWAAWRKAATPTWASVWVASPPTGLARHDRVTLTGTVQGTELDPVRWVRTGRSLPIRPFNHVDEPLEGPNHWEGALVAAHDARVTAIEGSRVTLEGGAVFELGSWLPPGLEVGQVLPYVVGVVHQEGGVKVMHARDAGDVRLEPLPEVTSVEALHRSEHFGQFSYLTVEDVVVTAIARDGQGLWVQDPDGGPLSGLYCWGSPDLAGVAVGDRVRVYGNVRDWEQPGDQGLVSATTQLTLWPGRLSRIEVVGAGELPAIAPLEPAQLADEEDARTWQGMLVRLEGLEVRGFDADTQEYLLSEGLRLGQDVVEVAPPLEVGEALVAATGVLQVGGSKVVLLPRSNEDLARRP